MISERLLGNKSRIIIFLLCTLSANGKVSFLDKTPVIQNALTNNVTELTRQLRDLQTNTLSDTATRNNNTATKNDPAGIRTPVEPLLASQSELLVDSASHKEEVVNLEKEQVVQATTKLPSEFPDDGIINPYKFTSVLSPTTLPLTDLDALIWVHTKPDHFRHRITLRETWGNSLNFHGLEMQMIFFMGLTNDQTTQTRLTYEAEFYQDIAQENYFDSYKNLTYKAMSGLKYITENYQKSNIKLIFKIDDDMLIDLDRVFDHFFKRTSFLVSPVNNTVLCHVYDKSRVKRAKNSKWRIRQWEFHGKWFPPYCAGAAVFLSHDLIPRMWYKAERTPFMWIDDVFFSGVVTQYLNNTWMHANRLYSFGGMPIQYFSTNWRSQPILHMSPYNHDQFYFLYKNRDRVLRISNLDHISIYQPPIAKPMPRTMTKDLLAQLRPNRKQAKIIEHLAKPFILP